MKNKKCWECRYMLHKDTFEVCTLCMTDTSMFDNACEHFTPPTNGDKIRQMSDEELAEKFVYRYCSTWRSFLLQGYEFLTEAEAIAATIKELKKEWKSGKDIDAPANPTDNNVGSIKTDL